MLIFLFFFQEQQYVVNQGLEAFFFLFFFLPQTEEKLPYLKNKDAVKEKARIKFHQLKINCRTRLSPYIYIYTISN